MPAQQPHDKPGQLERVWPHRGCAAIQVEHQPYGAALTHFMLGCYLSPENSLKKMTSVVLYFCVGQLRNRAGPARLSNGQEDDEVGSG